jgi:hypothetical protein
MLNEKKGTCCHKCGHVHVKGTSCPKPFLTGERSCARRSLKEAEVTDHYNERKEQRGTILDIEIPEPAYRGRKLEDVKASLIPKLQAELDKRLTKVETGDIGKSNNINLGLVVFMPVIEKDFKLYPITMISGDGPGRYYLVIAANNTLVTIYPSDKKIADLEKDIEEHIKREKPEDARPPKVDTLSNYIYKIDIDGNEVKDVEKKPEIQKTSEESLDYKVRTDYRVGANFDHKQYGTGKIVAAAGGGKAGTNGVVDWVDVKYSKPFMKGGKLQDIRRFNNILTAAYFGKTLAPVTESVDEVNEYCTACLIEYLLEYKDKIEEAEYRGRKVQLGKPFLTPGGPKKRSVYVKNAKGNVVKVNFGDPNMKIKKNIPSRRKSFRARHKCDSPGPRWKARYWSCKAW